MPFVHSTLKHPGAFVVLALAVCALMPSTPGAATETSITAAKSIAPHIQAITFHSDVLNAERAFCAVLPKAYVPTQGPWPVLFLFHGRGRNERSLIDDPGAREALLAAPFVTILPDGDDGWYINSPANPEDRYQDYLDEVIAIATTHFNLSTRRDQRGLSGWSMGGYGCARYAIANNDKFAALAPIIGLLDFPRSGLPDGQSYAVPEARFGADEAIWTAYNPITHAESLRDMALCIITGTTAFDRTMNMNFSRRLSELEIPHTLHVLNGAHTFEVVRSSLPLVVEFMATKLTHD